LLAAKDTAGVDLTTEAVLVAVELLTGPLRPDPLAESSLVQFHMLSAANKSPLPVLRPAGKDLKVRDKLAGNQIANFGAFLSARWRLNDWTWGRLDAAVSLVEIVAAKAETDPTAREKLRRLAQGGLEDSPQELRNQVVTRLHERILREELPLFAKLDVGPPSKRTLKDATEMADQIDVQPLLDVGQETVSHVIRHNPSLWKITAELGLVTGQSWGADSVKAGWNSLSKKADHTRDRISAGANELGQNLLNKLSVLNRPLDGEDWPNT
jgi:hypothetical protein